MGRGRLLAEMGAALREDRGMAEDAVTYANDQTRIGGKHANQTTQLKLVCLFGPT